MAHDLRRQRARDVEFRDERTYRRIGKPRMVYDGRYPVHGLGIGLKIGMRIHGRMLVSAVPARYLYEETHRD